MQTQGRLRLKSQVIARTHSVALDRPFARVWVDTGVFHLDGTYDYSVPEQFSAKVNTGVRVQVPFNGREVEAIVLERVEVAAVSGAIKSISKVLSIYPVATKDSLALIERVALIKVYLSQFHLRMHLLINLQVRASLPLSLI